MSHRFSLTLVAVALLAPAAGARAASCPGADTPVSSASLASAKAAVLCIVNAERAARGLPTLTENDRLALAAQRHTDDMVARDYFAHMAPDPAPFGVDPGLRITAAGYLWQAYGENIAVGQVTPREAMLDWMKSPGHCANILSPDVTQLGVGAAAVPATLGNQAGGTWTQDFANPEGTVAPPASGAPQAGCDPSGYAALAGLDAATQPDGTSSPGDAPVGQDPQNVEAPNAMTPTGPKLVVRLRVAARSLSVNGALRPADGRAHRAAIVVKRGHRVLAHVRVRLDARGRFHIRFTRLAGARRLTVRVSIGTLHATRTVGR